MDEAELAQLKEMVTTAVDGVETKLADSLGKAIAGLTEKLDSTAQTGTDIQKQTKMALEAVPNLIREHVENQLQVNLKGIVEEVSNKFEEKVKVLAGANGGGAGGGAFVDKIIANSDKLIGAVNAFRAPTTEGALMGQMNLIFRWHGLLSKLEKGEGSGEDITKAISETFTPPQGG